MATTDWRDWVASAEEGLRKLQRRCDRVFVAGLSVGGLITLHLAAHHSVGGVIAMAVPACIADWRFRFMPLAQHFVRWVVPDIESDLTDPEAEVQISAYDWLPTLSWPNTLICPSRHWLSAFRAVTQSG